MGLTTRQIEQRVESERLHEIRPALGMERDEYQRRKDERAEAIAWTIVICVAVFALVQLAWAFH
jgi:hypothetical protein